MKYAALLIVSLLCQSVQAQAYVWNGCYWVPAQCGGGCCQNWGCPPCNGGICYPQQRPQVPREPEDDGNEISGPLPKYELRPNQPAVNPPLPPPPAVQTPPLPPAPTIDPQAFKEQQAAIVKEIHDSQASIEKSLVIIRDKPGCQCDNKAVEAKLDQLIIAVGAIKIPAPAPAPSTQPAIEEHIVVVADHNSPYWQRLAEAITNARKTYHGIQDTTLPEFPIGEHPQAVVYRNSVPVRIVKGQYAVEALLSRLSRGEPI